MAKLDEGQRKVPQAAKVVSPHSSRSLSVRDDRQLEVLRCLVLEESYRVPGFTDIQAGLGDSNLRNNLDCQAGR